MDPNFQPQGDFEPGQAMLSTLLSNLPGLAYRCKNEPGWDMEYVSEGCLELTGYPPSALIHNHEIAYGDLILPADRDMVWSAVQQGINEHQSFRVTYRIRTATGEERWVWEQGRAVFDAEGEPQALEGLILDVTDRKRTETAEREQRALAETLAEVTLALASQASLSGLLRELLTQALRLVPCQAANIALIEDGILRPASWQGYTRYGSERFIATFTIPLNDEPLARSVLETGEPRVVADTGSDPLWTFFPATRWIRSHISVPIRLKDRAVGLLRLDSDQPCHFTADDIRRLQPLCSAAAVAFERARLLDDARQRAAELEAVRQATLGITSQQDLDAVLRAILVTTLRLLGGLSDAHIFLYDGERLAFGAAQYADGRAPDQLAELREDGLTYAVARTGETIIVADMADHPLFVTAPDSWSGGILGLPLKIGARVVGVMNVAAARARAWGDSEVRVLRLLADQAAIAIENAQLNEGIRRHAAELEGRVNERTAELQAANQSLRAAAEKLAEMARLKSEFVSNVSHELRTPLTNIRMYLELLESGKPGKTAQYLATLHREADLLQSLIEDILQLSRLDLGRLAPSFEPVDLNELAAGLVADRTAMAESRGLTMKTELLAQPLVAPGSRRWLIQVFSNLITNAMNYTPAGGTICVRTGEAAWADTDYALLAVQDSGLGILPAEQPRVFERFFRGSAAATCRQPGTGLGLAISQELIERHNGRITIQSEPGHGSTFTVWLPLRIAPDAANAG